MVKPATPQPVPTPNPPAPKKPTKIPRKSGLPIPPEPPLKPRRKLFVALLIAMALWILLLLILYMTTVYPHRDL